MTNQRELTIVPGSTIYPFPPISLLSFSLHSISPSLFTDVTVSIHRPSSGHIGGVLPTHCSGKCKMDVLRFGRRPVQKPDSRFLRVRRGRIIRMSYNVTASSKTDKFISRLQTANCEFVPPVIIVCLSRIRYYENDCGRCGMSTSLISDFR